MLTAFAEGGKIKQLKVNPDRDPHPRDLLANLDLLADLRRLPELVEMELQTRMQRALPSNLVPLVPSTPGPWPRRPVPEASHPRSFAGLVCALDRPERLCLVVRASPAPRTPRNPGAPRRRSVAPRRTLTKTRLWRRRSKSTKRIETCRCVRSRSDTSPRRLIFPP